jgi:hypothetical protein
MLATISLAAIRADCLQFEGFEMTLYDEVIWPGKGCMSLGAVFWELRGVFGAHRTIAITLTPDPSGGPPSILEAWPV